MKISEITYSKETYKPESKSGKSILERDIEFVPHKISDREKETIYRQLNVLQASGVDIRSSFEILFKQIKSKKTTAKLQGILAGLIKGKSISAAMAEYKDFSAYEVFSLKIGEETGKLNMVLARLTEYFENKIAQRRQLVSALSYPVLIVFTSIGAVSFMVFFIIPMFEEVFLRFNNELPALTKWVINMAALIENNVLWFFLSVGVLFIAFYYYRSNRTFRKFRESVLLKIPVAGEIYRQVYLARYCDSMGLLISSSVPMINTLDMVKKMIGFLHIEEILEDVKRELIQGKSLTGAMDRHTIFDDQMKALIKVGEEVNQLGVFFQKLSEDYTASVKHKTSLLSTFLEPVMIIFLGLIVGIILVAMYLPMFELSSSMDFG